MDLVLKGAVKQLSQLPEEELPRQRMQCFALIEANEGCVAKMIAIL
jgi:hypothetical protein